MSGAQEFLTKDAKIHSMRLNDTQDAFFLVFNANSPYSQALKDYFETPNLEIDLNYNEVDEYYILPKVTEQVGKIEKENQPIIKEICEQYLSERMFLAHNGKNILISDINYFNENTNSTILAVILIGSQDFQNLLNSSDTIAVSNFKFEVEGAAGK
jgi:hypothetical protein